MDILRRNLAPISPEAWEEISDEARDIFKVKLIARQLVDVDGPKGFDHAAVSLGRLEMPSDQKGDVRYGIRQVQPLVETRATFEVDQWELDNLARGSKDVDLDDLRRAAKEIARFEEEAMYSGFEPGGIQGLIGAAEHTMPAPSAGEDFPVTLSEAILHLHREGVQGPFNLVLGPELYQKLLQANPCYPIRRQVDEIIGGTVHLAPFLAGGLLLPGRGGDAELTLGQDISIGYESHTSTTVKLYFTESFTFRVLAPEAVVRLKG